MVVDPDHEDRADAKDKRDVGGPQISERPPELTERRVYVNRRYTNLQYQERRCDGDDAIAKRFRL